MRNNKTQNDRGVDSVDNSTRSNKAKKLVKEHRFDYPELLNKDTDKQVEGISKKCGYSSPTDLALAMVDSYCASDSTEHAPKILAASAVYAASIQFDCREKQRTIALEYNTTSSSIRRLYGKMLDQVV